MAEVADARRAAESPTVAARDITPLMPYFPLIVTFTQKYDRGTGIGTLISGMLPHTVGFMAAWTLFLLAYWGVGLPLGPGSGYVYGG